MTQPSTPDEDFLQQTFEACNFHRYLHLSLEVVAPGKVRVHLAYVPELDQAMGMLHGGVYAALLDTASYYAALSVYGSTGRLPLTQEYKINLLASASEEDLIAESEIVKAGKRSAVVETRIRSASDTLVAIGLTSLQIRG